MKGKQWKEYMGDMRGWREERKGGKQREASEEVDEGRKETEEARGGASEVG